MTTEQIRLEIQLEVKKALADLGSVSEEFKRLANEAKKYVPAAQDVKSIMAKLDGDLKTAAKSASLFGDELGTMKQQQASLKAGMIQLLEHGLEPQAEEIQKLKAQYDKLGEEFKDVSRQSSLTSGSLGDLAGALGQLAAVKVLSDVAGQVLAVGDAALETAKQWEKQQANFGVLLGSAEAGRAIFKELQAFNVWTPFDLDNITNTAQVLMGADVAINDLTDTMTMFGDLSLGNAEKFSSFANEFAKVAVKGKVDMGNLNIYLERGIPILTTLADQFGVTGAQVQDMVSKGLVSTRDFERALVSLTSEGGLYYKGMVTGSQSLEAVQIGLKEALDSLGASFMQGFIPALKLSTQFLTDVANAINDSPLLKGMLAGAITAVTGYLVAMAIRTAALTVKTWLQYAAQMGLNSALAVTNPLLIGAILVVGGATAAAVAYAASQNKVADETDRVALATVASARELSSADKAAKEYTATLDALSDAELRSARSAILAAMQRTTGMDALTVAQAKLKALDKEIDERAEAAIKASADDLAKKAAAFKASWADLMAKARAETSLDPFTGIEYERGKKLAEAAANGIGEKNKAIIDEINAYYDTKRRAISEGLARDEEERLRKLSSTKIDDLEAERDSALASLTELEAKRLLAVGASEAERLAISSRYAEMRASLEAGYDKKILETRVAETRAAAEMSWDATNAAAVAAAKLTESRVDDLILERDKALTLFEGAEDQKLMIARSYARKIADARIVEDRRVFEETMRLASSSGNYGQYALLKGEDAVKDTEAGKMLGAGGALAVDPVSLMIESLIDFALSIENVQKVLNPFGTILEGAKELLEPLVNDALQPIVDHLFSMGKTLAETLSPALSIIAIGLRLFSVVLQVATIPARILGKAFSWLNDYVIVPFGNAVIDAINAVITAINSLPDWVTGGDLAYLDRLETTAEIASKEALIAERLEYINNELEKVREMFAKRRKEVEDEYSKNIASLRKLLEIGAMGEEEYDRRVDAANTARDVALSMLKADEDAQTNVLEQIRDQLQKGILVSSQSQPVTNAPQAPPSTIASGAGAMAGGAAIAPAVLGLPGAIIGGAIGGLGKAFGWWDIGAVELPQDQFGMVHKKEMIVPASFAEGVRRGDISIGKGKDSGTTEVYNVTINVAGSIRSDNEVVDLVLEGMQSKRRRGALPAGVN